MLFKNRSDAGKKLAEKLKQYKDLNPVVLALPRGGAVVAAEVARALKAPLDLVLVRKLGVPFQPELAMGAVVDGADPYIVRNESILAQLESAEEVFQDVCQYELSEIERRRELYLKDRPRAKIEGNVVIVVDDGIATGATMRAALGAVSKQGPKRLVLAVPVAAASSLEELGGQADDIVCLDAPEPLYAIGYYYKDFTQVTDSEVIDILAEFAPSKV